MFPHHQHRGPSHPAWSPGTKCLLVRNRSDTNEQKAQVDGHSLTPLLTPTCGSRALGLFLALMSQNHLPKRKKPPLTCNMSSHSSRPTKMSSRGSRWRVPLLLTRNHDVTLILALRRPAWPCRERVNSGAPQPGLWSPGYAQSQQRPAPLKTHSQGLRICFVLHTLLPFSL